MSMTVSISKGKKLESNFRHNERKTQLKDQPQEVVESFYETENHRHIKSDLTRLNIDQPHENFGDVYDKLFGKAIENYNSRQKRKDRMIGKGKAVSGQVKKANIIKLKVMLKYLSSTELQRKKFIDSLGGQEIFESTFEKYKDMTEEQLKKELKGWKSQETYGEAYYKKIKNDGKSRTHIEFIAQIGSAEDFNEVKNGKIVKSYDRENPAGKWQKSKKVLKKYIDGFQERNPNLILVGYSIHMDENSPHIHFDIVPVADQSKTQSRGKKKIGLSKKISFDGALQSEGFTGSPKNLFKTWQNQEADILADLMEKEMGEKRKPGKTNSIKNVHEYKRLKKLEAEKLEKLVEVDKKVSQKESTLKDLDSKSQELNARLSESTELVKKTQAWADSKKNELDSREKQVISKELKIASKEEELSTRENNLKQDERILKAKKIEFNEKVEETGNLTEQLVSLRKTVKNYSSGMEEKKKEILNKKQKELDEKLAKQAEDYKKQVEANKQAYLTEFNRQYRESLERREKIVEQREKQFAAKIKNFVDDFRLAYISVGLKSMFGKQSQIDYAAKKYLTMNREDQKAIERQAFSGVGGLYRKLSAFSEAVDHVFDKNIHPLSKLASEAKVEAENYENMKKGRERMGNHTLTRDQDREL